MIVAPPAWAFAVVPPWARTIVKVVPLMAVTLTGSAVPLVGSEPSAIDMRNGGVGKFAASPTVVEVAFRVVTLELMPAVVVVVASGNTTMTSVKLFRLTNGSAASAQLLHFWLRP